MRMRRILVGLALVAAGCGPMRSAAPPVVPHKRVATTPVAPRKAKAPSEPARARELACVNHPRIDGWETRMRSHQSHNWTARRVLERGQPYLPRLREIMTEEGLPESLALLPGIESGFRPRARGHFGDVGMWQLRKPTARRFGLVVHNQRDDRLDPFRSSQAAARYLRYLNRRYRGDWPFALAAYNAGEGRVDRARARFPKATFWELADRGQLPKTSREFVPRFFALVRLSELGVLCQPNGLPALQQASR
jgi:hypothetical protein